MKPPLILSSLDVDRLEHLLGGMPAFPGKDDLEREIGRADIVEPAQMPPDVVSMNSTVRFEVEGGGEPFELTLVYPHGVKREGGTISVLAPVGSALLGVRKGAQIEWPRPGGGSLTVRIVDITYQPERAGDLHR